MNYKLIDVTNIKTKKELYDAVETALDTPDYFGRNLDALHDILAGTDLTLIILGFESLKENMGSYADALAGMLIDTENESRKFRVIIR